MHISGITKRMLAIFPEMELQESGGGQLVVYTGAYAVDEKLPTCLGHSAVGHYAPVREEDFDIERRFTEILAVMAKESLERTGRGLCNCGHPEDTGLRDHSPDCEYERACEKAWGQAEKEELGHK